MSICRWVCGLAILATVVVLGGCGASGEQSATPATTAQPATIRAADCRLWRRLSTGQRQNLLVSFRSFFGARVDVPGTRGQILGDRRATALLGGYCRHRYASAFKLYKIYGRAAAFTPAR